MNEEDIPKYWEFANPILKYLKENGTAEYVHIIAKDVAEIVRKERNLPESVYEFKVSNGTSKIYDRIGWGKKEKNDSMVEKQSSSYFSNINSEIENADDREIDWQEKLVEILRNLKPKNFEILCKKVLEHNGFVDVKVTGKTGDFGIDGIGILRQSLISTKVLFQCKRYNSDNKITPSTVRDFRGSMSGRANYGLIITTSEFTEEAKKEAKREGVDPIELIDGWELCTLIKKTNSLGVKTKIVEQVDIDYFYYEKFDT